MLAKLNREHNESFLPILISFVTFGEVRNKAKKVTREAEIYIESLGSNFGANQLYKADYLHDSHIRISTLNYILTNQNLDEPFFNTLIQLLIEKDRTISNGNVKFSINSLIHRERLRIQQTILSLLPKLAESNYELVLSYCDELLLAENQPSLRATCEWIYIKILAFNIDKLDVSALWAKVDGFSFYKVGYTFSWLNILFHLAPLLPEDKKVSFKMIFFYLANFKGSMTENFFLKKTIT